MKNYITEWILALVICVLLIQSAAAQQILYVDADATGDNNGTSWENAYNYLQDALTDADVAAKPVEIWVAEGVYKPDQGSGITLGDRTATFQLKNGVTIKGGYAGYNATDANDVPIDPNTRDIKQFETVLSGDLDDNDGPGFSNDDKNSYHVVTGSGTDATAVLDGFTIIGGNASHYPDNDGGGMEISLSSLAITNCTFSGNWAEDDGGGIHIYESNITVTNCTFTDNSAGYGGGMGMSDSNIVVTDCTFSGNQAEVMGGGICTGGSDFTVTNCTFTGNSAEDGGGMYNAQGITTVTDCTFTGNKSAGVGGGMASSGSSSTVTDCTFTGNSAEYGGGICNWNRGSLTVTNCTFTSNSADESGGGINDWESRATVTDCTFSDNWARDSGGGICIYISNFTVRNCTFTSNSAKYGGGMYNAESSPTVSSCTFSENSAEWGSGMYNGTSSPTVTNCIFSENSAEWGGGMYNADNSSPTVTNCIFSGNSAGREGGGMSVYKSSPTVTNCTFSANFTHWVTGGGGIYASESYIKLTNCIFWGNCDQTSANENAQIHYSLWEGDNVSHCCVQGLTSDHGGTGNIGLDPMFMRGADDGGDGWADDPVTPDVNEAENNDLGDLHLLSESPCIDAGNSAVLPPDTADLDEDGDTTEPIQFDLDGATRIVGPAVDVGAYEYQHTLLIHVDVDATGAEDGTSWQNAYVHLQDALDRAGSAIKPVEIRVAQGVYWPDQGASQTERDREATFQLINGVTISGGYAGFGAPDPNERDIGLYETVLSGDLNDDDGPDFAINGKNSHHVVTGSGTDSTAVLDGFVVTGGSANGSSAHNSGGGIYIEDGYPALANCTVCGNLADKGAGLFSENGSPVLTNCDFTANWAQAYGGGVYNGRQSNPELTDCVFTDNVAGRQGGAIKNDSSEPVLRCCIFTGNSAGDEGGGISNVESSPTLIDCKFGGNSAVLGGGIFNDQSTPTVVNCTFNQNMASERGGGMFSSFVSSPVLSNCTFNQNWAGERGGGMHNHACLAMLTNCTFVGNSAELEGGGICNAESKLSLSNCILWGNTARTSPEIHSYGSTVTVTGTHCNIQGSLPSECGEDSIDVYPVLTPDGHLTALSPCIDKGTDVDIPQTDRNDESRLYGAGADIGSDEFIDTDGDGLPDWWESKHFGSPTTAEPNDDPDGDYFINIDEYELYGSNPVAPPIHVNRSSGPLRTIQEGIDLAMDGDTVLVASGTYTGYGNYNLDYGGKSVVVLAPNAATIDCGNSGRAINFETIKGTFGALEGFVITGGSADLGGGIRIENSRFIFKDCILRDNTADKAGGFYSLLSTPTINNLSIQGNTADINEPNAGLIESSNIDLQGSLTLETGKLDVISSWFYGSGKLNLHDGTLLKITGEPSSGSTVIRADANGPGNIEIAMGQQLIIEGDAIVNLSGASGQNPDPNSSRITVNGSLVVRGNATLEGTNVDVKLFDVNTPNNIQYNNITLQEASTGFGGEFFVSENAKIKWNNIVSEGDRYLDMDPDPLAQKRPTITNNRITVIIKEGTLGSQGTLLELRARDYDCGWLDLPNPDCASGAYQVSIDSNGFTDDPSWVLERLELKENAKLNLTNRQGFEFQDFSDPNVVGWETVYVKELVMGPNSVLNTALQTLYYQTLVLVDSNGDELSRDPNDLSVSLVNGSRFEDIPLLGFSLGIIALNDPAEFDIRVRKRLRDPRDFQPEPPKPPKEGSIERLDDDPNIPADSGGVMDMRTQAPGKQSASSVAAKGAFARAGDEDITIEFEYMFLEPHDDAKIIVYLSDKPEVDGNIFEVARIYPPHQSGLPGSSASGQFAVFSGMFSRGDLNFTRGTYVQLELHGKNTRCWIDNWDPQIYCNICCDYDGFGYINIDDYYLLLAEFGLSGPSSDEDPKGCLDLVTDGYVTMDDVIAWDAIGALWHNSGKNACPWSAIDIGPGEPVIIESLMSALSVEAQDYSSGSVPLCLFGKPYQWKPFDGSNSYLYGVNPEGFYVENILDTRSGPYGRLMVDGKGRVYQIASNGGLVGSDGLVVEPKKDIPYKDGKSLVSVGFHDGEGVLLLDAVFNPGNPNLVYVVPVLVDPNDGNCPYMAAAKLELKGGGDWDLLKLYGKNPIEESSHTNLDCANFRSFVYQPDVYHLHEIEIDSAGKNLFVLSRCWFNKNNWVLIYDEDEEVDNDSQVCVWLSDPDDGYPDVDGPAAMFVSSHKKKVFLASSVYDLNEPNDLVTEVYGFAMNKNGQRVVDLSLAPEDIIEINCPLPSICAPPSYVCDPSLGYVSMVSSIAENPLDGTLYVTGFTAPKFDELPHIDEIFTTPMLAVVPPDVSSVDAYPITGSDLALPLSIVWIGAKCGGVDLTLDGEVDMNDLDTFASYWLHTNCGSFDWCSKADVNRNGRVDFVDFTIMAEHWLETDCEQ